MFQRILGILAAALFGSYAFVAVTVWRDTGQVGPLRYGTVAALIALGGFGVALGRPSTKAVATAQGIILGALTFGLLGLFGGVYAGGVLWPHSNLGPGVGFLVTGPAGVLAGAAIGGLLARRSAKARDE